MHRLCRVLRGRRLTHCSRHPACRMEAGPPTLPRRKGHSRAGVTGLGHGVSEKPRAGRKGSAAAGRAAAQDACLRRGITPAAAPRGATAGPGAGETAATARAAGEASDRDCHRGEGVRMSAEDTFGQWGSPAVEEGRRGGGGSCLTWDLKKQVKCTSGAMETGPPRERVASGGPFKPVLRGLRHVWAPPPRSGTAGPR